MLGYLKQNFEESKSDTYREWMTQYMSAQQCAACPGRRLRPESLAVKVGGHLHRRFHRAPLSVRGPDRREDSNSADAAPDRRSPAASLQEMPSACEFLLAVGLGYISLDRSAATLSGGEAQRIRLATQIGSRLRGVLYVLDEPSIGLHARDNDRLLDTLEQLRDLGNTVLVVEHDEETIRRADYVIDLGPGAGQRRRLPGRQRHAGANRRRVPTSLTGPISAGAVKIPVPSERRSPNGKAITVLGAREQQPEESRRRHSRSAC